MSYDEPKQFRKLPVVIDAMRWMGNNQPEIEQWLEYAAPEAQYHFALDYINIRTLEGVMKADLGDWIICGVKKEIYPCKDDIFKATYEAA